MSEANESQTSYYVEQVGIFQYKSYSHSDDMFITLKSNINMDTSICFVFFKNIKVGNRIHSLRVLFSNSVPV